MNSVLILMNIFGVLAPDKLLWVFEINRHDYFDVFSSRRHSLGLNVDFQSYADILCRVGWNGPCCNIWISRFSDVAILNSVCKTAFVYVFNSGLAFSLSYGSRNT